MINRRFLKGRASRVNKEPALVSALLPDVITVNRGAGNAKRTCSALDNILQKRSATHHPLLFIATCVPASCPSLSIPAVIPPA